MPFRRLCPDALIIGPTFKYHHIGGKVSTYEFCGDTHIQSITVGVEEAEQFGADKEAENLAQPAQGSPGWRWGPSGLGSGGH